jgi:CBS domain containing-hemolysin-like protein
VTATPPPRGLRERLRALAHPGEAHPPASERTQEIIRRVHELAHLEVRDVMTPRVDVVYLTMPVTPEAVADAVRDTGHSCFPVVVEDLDDVDGVLFVNDLFRSSTTKRALGVSLPNANEIARKIRRPPVMLPETMDVLEALEEMRNQRRTFALVLDEHGGVAGVVSTRDLLEPLVGDLNDEFDEDDEPTIARIRDDRWLVDGQTHVDEVAQVIGIEIPEGEYVTIAGFLLDLTGEVPPVGREVTFGRYRLRVQSVEKRRISEVVIERLAPAPSDDAEEARAGSSAPSRAE